MGTLANSENPDEDAAFHQSLYCLLRQHRPSCFVALRPKSTDMVMAGWSVDLTTLFLGKLEQAVNQYFVHFLSLVTNNNPS